MLICSICEESISKVDIQGKEIGCEECDEFVCPSCYADGHAMCPTCEERYGEGEFDEE